MCAPSLHACLQKAAEYAVGGGKELNRVSYLSQARALYAYCLCRSPTGITTALFQSLPLV